MNELTIEELRRLYDEGGMFAWEMMAARNECGWICASCCCTFNEGMPDECPHSKTNGCTEIIERDKRWAQLLKDENV